MGKTRARKTIKPREAPITWRDVLRVVQGDETRFYVTSSLRDRGFSPDSFGHTRFARETVSGCLTHLEGRLELTRGVNAQAERLKIRSVRRRLELELWP